MIVLKILAINTHPDTLKIITTGKQVGIIPNKYYIQPHKKEVLVILAKVVLRSQKVMNVSWDREKVMNEMESQRFFFFQMTGRLGRFRSKKKCPVSPTQYESPPLPWMFYGKKKSK